MKKHVFYNRVSFVLIIICIITMSFMGCKSKTKENVQNTQERSNQNSQNRKFDPQAMRDRYESVLKELVADGTITQAQSDKVLVYLTNNMPKPGTEPKITSGQQKSPEEKSKDNVTDQGRPRNKQLAELVSTGVITQAQADKINSKLSEKMKNLREEKKQ